MVKTNVCLLTLMASFSHVFGRSANVCSGHKTPLELVPGGHSLPFTLQSGGLERSYRVALPTSYDGTTPSPVILSFHGAGQDAIDQEFVSALNNTDYNTKYIAVYPNGYLNETTDQRSWQGADYTGVVNDVQFVKDLLSQIETQFCIDTERLYAVGKSNGGGFVALMTCDPVLSTAFKAFATVSAALYPATHTPCDPDASEIVPLISFHGMDDPTINYYGGSGRGGDYLDIPGFLAGKARLDNTTTNPVEPVVTVDLSGNVWKKEWFRDPESDPRHVVLAFNETGLGHKWPGTEQVSADFVDATPEMIAFFDLWK